MAPTTATAAPAAAQVVPLREDVFHAGRRRLRIDREKCIIYGCKVLGENSKNSPPNNNTYPRSTRDQAARVMEGGRCFINHNDDTQRGQGRRYEDSFGTHINVRSESDGVFSDLKYNPRHPLAEQVLWDAENAPHNLGFSIATNGRRKVENGRAVVQEILWDRQSSIDLVSRGATTNSISESERGMSSTAATAAPSPLSSFTAAERVTLLRNGWLPRKDGGAISLREAIGSPAADGDAKSVDASMPPPAPGGETDEVKKVTEAFVAMMTDVSRELLLGKIDMATARGKFDQLIKAFQKLTDTPAGDSTQESLRRVPAFRQFASLLAGSGSSPLRESRSGGQRSGVPSLDEIDIRQFLRSGARVRRR
jgi:hypothetical protein